MNLRIYARVKIVKIFGVDDWLMVAAYVSWPAGDNLTSDQPIIDRDMWRQSDSGFQEIS